MKCIIIEVEDVIAKNWKISGKEVRERVARIVARELKYPVGYARPDEKEAWLRHKKNLANLPEYFQAVEKLQKEAKKNGLTQEILDKILAEDEK